MKCEEYWPETCEMQFGDIKAAPLSVEDRQDRVVRKLAVSKVTLTNSNKLCGRRVRPTRYDPDRVK